ncbi:MAG: hypothetical protein Q8Q42_01980 [Nanoarchaeota archaeon]|nr:hypothetical protein [Nanoarchaeota archaeon]
MKFSRIYRKKGDTSILFNWIFAIIAGAVILMFFVKFSFVSISGNKMLEGNRILVFLDDKLDAFGVGEGSDTINLNDDFKIGFSCGVISSGETANNNFYERSTDKVLFSPQILKGDEIKVWTKKWEFPYGIATFFYLGNPKNRILFVAESYNVDEVLSIADNIPPIFKVQVTDKQKFDPGLFLSQVKGYDKFTVVYFGTPSFTVNQLKSLYGVNVEVIIIDLENNTAKIYDSFGNVYDEFYIGDEMMYGLIFSGSGYSCIKERAIQRYQVIDSIYSDKVTRLMGKTKDQTCIDMLNEARKMLDNYRYINEKDDFYDMFDRIKKQNEDLEKKGCSGVYL